MLYIFSGLPATGKSELSQHLSNKLGDVYLRIDSIEQALKDNDFEIAEGQGYEVAYKIALDNLKLGLSVVADSVNPLPITRKAWRKVAHKSGSKYCDIEIICSDKKECNHESLILKGYNCPHGKMLLIATTGSGRTSELSLIPPINR